MTAPTPAGRSTPDRALGPGTPMLLATAADAAGRPATRVALALAAERGFAPRAIRVHDVPGLDAVALGLPACADIPADAGDGDEAERLRAELAAAGMPAGAPWAARVDVGLPAACIVREAERSGAGLVILGLRRHGLADRALGDNAAAHVMRDAPCPVLGVADEGRPALAGLPRRVLVGVDFGRASRRAAEVALALVADGGTVVLAYVDSAAGPTAAPLNTNPPGEADDGAAVVHALGVEAAGARLAVELRAAAPAGRATVECRTVPGRPGRTVAGALLEAAEREGADLVAVATQRMPRVMRLLLGSVTAELARDGRHSLLVVPPAGRA